LQAVSILREVLASDSDNFEANYALGTLCDRSGRGDLSLPLLRKAVRLRPNAFDAILRLGNIERLQGMAVDALEHFERAVSIRPDSVEALSALGSTHIDCNDSDAALAAFNQALAVKPDSEEINTKLGSLHAINGEAGMAADCFRRVILHHPHCGDAHYGLAFLQQARAHASDTEAMLQAFASDAIADHDKSLVGYALGKTYEELAQFDTAFGFTSQANQLQRSLVSYSHDEQKSLFDRHARALDQSFIEHCKGVRIDDDAPVFVVGMPRSGTSLVEQILASHPLVYGAGEVEFSRFFAEDVRKMTGKPFPLDIETIAPQRLHALGLDYVRRLKGPAGSARRVVDKLPHNFLRVGLFAALMPNAKFVVCTRNPLDNCLSIYQHNFSTDHGYATDLADLGRYYKLYENLMSFWTEIFPGRIYRLCYEQLVDDTDAQTRQLLSYCELPFHDDCLAFYESRRMVVTPSSLQVREPMHSKSIGRASNYEPHLQPLISALAEADAVT
jgi:tetratricopeptide (TPR) repeat protein